MWALSVGPHRQLLERRAEQGLPTPALAEAPELYEDLADVWDAFVDLSATRPAGWGASPIPFTEIEAWLRLHEVHRPQDKQDYAYLIRALDQTWLETQGQQHGQTQSDR